MSGHSKWANIKHRKGAQDAKRAKVFTKILKEITIASRMGGGDPNANPRLRTALDKGKENNVPKDNMDRAIKKGTGDLDGVNYEEYTYEGYAAGGVAVLVEVMSDNRNRSGGEVRNIFTKNNGNMAEAGAVSWNFERKGTLTVHDVSEEDIMDLAIENNADDFEDNEGSVTVYCAPENFEGLRSALIALYKVTDAEVTMVPKNTVKVEDSGTAKQILKLLDALEDHDDVQNVFANFDMDDALLEEE